MKRRVLFDVSRLLSRTSRGSPTGVDRVCLAYGEWLSARSDIDVIPLRTKAGRLIAVDKRWFRTCLKDMRTTWTNGQAVKSDREAALVEALSTPRDIRSPLREVVPDIRPEPQKRWNNLKQSLASRSHPKDPDGACYLNVGHTGVGDGVVLSGLRARGIECIVLIHDLIPITHPEFCRPGDGEKHRTRVLNTLHYASRIIVNSAYTEHELELFAAREGLPLPEVHVAYLGLEQSFLEQPLRLDVTQSYFVHVGTIEARKNLAFLLTLWRRIEEDMGARTPQLVLVGRYGWENEAVIDHLERSPSLQSLVHHVSDLPDAGLARLMLGARALLAPSSVEGFDLPAVEASVLGLPVIASDIPAHRELVPHACLVDPVDGPGWISAIKAADSRSRVVFGRPAPTWDQHFTIVAEALGLDSPETASV